MTNDSNKTTLFDFLNDISHLKKNILSEENEREYNSYMINRFLSMDTSTVLYANEMNKNAHLPKHMQYDYYFHAIKKHKRYFKYIKHQRQEDIEVICEYHQCNEVRGREMLSLFSKDDIEYMKSKLFKGGVSK